MNVQLIEGLSAVGVSLLILGIFVGTYKENTTSDMSNHGLIKDLGYSTHSSFDDSVRSRFSSEDTYTFGGKRKNKNNKTRKK
jgi:hypothetical protein